MSTRITRQGDQWHVEAVLPNYRKAPDLRVPTLWQYQQIAIAGSLHEAEQIAAQYNAAQPEFTRKGKARISNVSRKHLGSA